MASTRRRPTRRRPRGRGCSRARHRRDIDAIDAPSTRHHTARCVNSGSRDALVLQHDARARQHRTATLVGHQQEVCGLSWSADGATLASGGNENYLCLWDAARSGQAQPSECAPRAIMRQHQVPFQRPSSRPSSSSGCLPDGRRRRRGAAGRRRRRHWRRRRRAAGRECCYRAGPVEERARGAGPGATDGDRRAPRPPGPRRHRRDRPPTQAAVKALSWCPMHRNLLASGGGTADRTIKFWNAHTGAMLHSVDTGSQVCALLWSRHHKEIVSSHGFSQNQLCLWRYPSMHRFALRADGPYG